MESDLVQDKVLLKIDFRNAFNSVRRDVLLQLVKNKLPVIYPFILQCYGDKSNLFFGDDSFDSMEGVQQGDPLGPFLFSLAIMDNIKSMKSELNVWYLDEGTLAGDVNTVLEDYRQILKALESHRLEVNPSKCEFFLIRPQSRECLQALTSFKLITEGVIQVDKSNLTLLGAPIFPEAVSAVLESKLENLEIMAGRLKQIDSHSTLFLLKNCFSMPKLLYFLRSSPCFLRTDILQRYDSIIKNTLANILCIKLDDPALDQAGPDQATLPVSSGGLGLPPAKEVALSGYLSSVEGSSKIIQVLLPENLRHNSNPYYESALIEWKRNARTDVTPDIKVFQSKWDRPMYVNRFLQLFQSSPEAEKARLISISAESSSIWLDAIPIPSLGLHLNPMSLKIACGLHLGSFLCQPHVCSCGVMVDPTGCHGLSCKKQRGRYMRHEEVNKLIKRGLDQEKITSTLEPIGLSRSGGGHRPDGLTFPTWTEGKCLIWDFTVADTLCGSYVKRAAKEACSAAVVRERKKVENYSNLLDSYHFVPVGAETYGAFGPQGLTLLKQIGKKIQSVTVEKRSTYFFLQSISMAIQPSNAACVIGTAPASTGLEGLFKFFTHDSEDIISG